MSDTNGKVKIHKNPNRGDNSEHKPYVPQYQIYGIQPSEYGATSSPNMQIAKPSTHNPREGRMPALRQPYAEATESPIGTGPVPNVGNNMEHTWSSVDGEIIDDLTGETVNPDQMIDNNEFLTDQAFGFQAGVMANEIQQNNKGKILIENESIYDDSSNQSVIQSVIENNSNYVVSSNIEAEELMPIVANLADNSFLLIVSGVPVCSGPKEEIEEQARAIVFGEHDLCDGHPVEIDDIIILKRVKIKVGLFLD